MPVSVIETKQGLRPARADEKGIPSLRDSDWVVIRGLQAITAGASARTIEGKMDAGNSDE